MDARNENLVITAGKLLGIIVAIVTLTLGATTFIYTTVIDSKLDRLELRLHERFATRVEAVDRREYELRHAALDEGDKRIIARLNELEAKMKALEGSKPSASATPKR